MRSNSQRPAGGCDKRRALAQGHALFGPRRKRADDDRRADGSRDAAAEAEFFDFVRGVYGLGRADMAEVAPSFDTLGMLRRMQKAHHGAVHRLHREEA